ncbi:MAG: DUF1684 domain-containing protein [Polaribacter sp.]|nr:DUF1684 domain-containing protein [Polaribacter sp.]
MKNILVLFSFLIFAASCSEDTYEKEILNHQYKQNLEFQDKNTSPLTKEDLKEFQSLDFYAIDKNFRVLATLTKTPNALVFEMPTTTSRKPLYKKYGVLTFTVNGKEQELNIYQSQDFDRDPTYKDYLFLPFTDTTSGQESYAGGRFLDVLTTDEKKGKMLIDFNKAYNPYCAYSGRYSCPITPKENHLTVAIRAGVKAYKKH